MVGSKTLVVVSAFISTLEERRGEMFCRRRRYCMQLIDEGPTGSQRVIPSLNVSAHTLLLMVGF